MTFARRDVLRGTAALIAASSACDRAFARDFAGTLRAGAGTAAFAAHPVGSEVLWLTRPDGEEIFTRFRANGAYDRAAILQLSWFMRDVADANRGVWMEPRLFDLLGGVQAGLSRVNGAPVPLAVTSGYRTPAHNARIETAARNSMHLYGYAADIKVPGYSSRAVALAASFFAQGGIGLYDGFTHLDVWKVRMWSGASGAAHALERPATPLTAPHPSRSGAPA